MKVKSWVTSIFSIIFIGAVIIQKLDLIPFEVVEYAEMLAIALIGLFAKDFNK